MKRPDVVWHMTSWGFVSGWILAHLYASAMFSFSPYNEENILQILFQPALWMMTFILGAMPGIVIGFISSYFLYFLLRKAPLPFTRNTMKNYRTRIYTTAGIITSLLFSPISYVVFWLLRALEEPIRTSQWVFIIPVIIAAITATYAAHRYMFRLRLWSESLYVRKSKTKSKNSDARLLNILDHEATLSEMEEIADYQKQDYL